MPLGMQRNTCRDPWREAWLRPAPVAGGHSEKSRRVWFGFASSIADEAYRVPTRATPAIQRTGGFC
jgi:hypothetical protein